MKVPSNIITKNKYTIGNELVYLKSHKDYQGYYYELNNKFFAGKVFNSNSEELIKIKSKDFNTLLTQGSTYAYGLLSKTKIINNNINSIVQGNSNYYDKGGELFLKFYCKKINANPILIKEINEQTYLNLQKNSIYQTIFIGAYEGKIIAPEQAYSQMIGLKEFIEG